MHLKLIPLSVLPPSPMSRKAFPILLVCPVVILFSLVLLPAAGSLAAAPPFADIPPERPYAEAILYLASGGVLRGYADGTFRPNQKVTRAEAVKIVVAPLDASGSIAPATATVFSDIPDGVWYLPYAEAARSRLGIIDGPPKTSEFHGDRPVTKAEFLKILLLADRVDVAGTSADISVPLSTDVRSPDDWFYPVLRTALALSVTMVDEHGQLSPGRELTRAEVALFVYRFRMYRQGRRLQSLLSEAENENINTVRMLTAGELGDAEEASARALLAARGAAASRPDFAVVQSALKVAEGFRSLVQASRAQAAGRWQDVVTFAGEAWRSAAKAGELKPALGALTDRMQRMAKVMADQARRVMSGSP
jgi:hypothetical protein